MEVGIFETLIEYLQYPFVVNALIVGVLVAFCSSLLGVTLVLKRFSFIGDGLSHVAFGGVAIAIAFNMNKSSMFIALPITIICAIILLRSGEKVKISGDAQIALVSVGALALGYLIINKFSTSANISSDVCTTLFGSTSILTLSQEEVILCVVLSILVAIFFLLFYNKLFSMTFDENFSRAIGVNVDLYNLIMAIVIAVIIVLAMNLVGSILISALVIFPALSSMQVFKSFKAVTISAAIYSVITSLLGIIVSILFNTPVGSTIVAIDIIGFMIFWILGKM